MYAEEQILEDIFVESKLWKNKYKISWCDSCATAIITCSICNNSSCNGSSCKECHEDSVEFSQLKTSPHHHLSKEEMVVVFKLRLLQEYIRTCLYNGKIPIDWLWLKESDALCPLAEELFQQELNPPSF